MNPKIANKVFIIALLSGAVISGIGSNNGPQWLTFFGLAMMCGGLILRVMCYRCPHCNAYLDRSRGEFCPYCGKNIYPDRK